MTRTQIQLPDSLFERAKRVAAEREVSLAELTRRGLELLLARYPSTPPTEKEWQLPKLSGGGLKVKLEDLREVMFDDYEQRVSSAVRRR